MIRALKPNSIQTYDIATLGMCRDGTAREVKASVILPHEMWRQLSSAGALHAVMGHPSTWHSFWQAVQNEEWFTNHPMRHFCLEYGHKACPVVIHGDGAPIGKQHSKRALRVVQWSSPCSSGSTLQRKIIIATNPEHAALKDLNERDIDTVIAWSFEIALANVMPRKDHRGEPLTGQRAREAGKVLNKDGCIMIYIGTCGDWKFMKDQYNLDNHYGCNACCHMCFANKTCEPCMQNALPDAPWTMVMRSSQDFVTLKVAQQKLHPWCQMPGWHLHSLFEDVVHDDLLGVRQILCGGALMRMVDRHWFCPMSGAGDWKKKANRALAVAWARFGQWLKNNQLSCTTTPFSVTTLSLKTRKSKPALKCKASNCATVSKWIAEECSEFARQDENEHNAMLNMTLKAFCDLYVLYHIKGIMTPRQARQLEDARQRSLLGFNALTSLSSEGGRQYFVVKPKFHKLDHLLRRAVRTRVSPSAFWTFQDEDMMGIMASLARNCRLLLQGPAERWLLHYFSVTIPAVSDH